MFLYRARPPPVRSLQQSMTFGPSSAAPSWANGARGCRGRCGQYRFLRIDLIYETDDGHQH